MNTTATDLLRLMSWLSPVFPIGGYAYSAGLEQAVHLGHVGTRKSLVDWIEVQLTQGAQWNDAVLLVQASKHFTDAGQLADLASLCRAMCASRERLAETLGQGASFRQAICHWTDPARFPGAEIPLPVAIGIAAGAEQIDPRLTASAYLHAFVSNQLQCAIRLSVLGQDGAARTLSELEPVIERQAERAAAATLEDLGSAGFIADIASMKHETLEPRLFLS